MQTDKEHHDMYDNEITSGGAKRYRKPVLRRLGLLRRLTRFTF